MWGKLASAFLFWLAAILSAIKLLNALPVSPGRIYYFNDSFKMILVGCSFLLLAAAINKILHIFSEADPHKNNLKDTHSRDPDRLICYFETGE